MRAFNEVNDKSIKERQKRLEMPFKSFCVLLPVLTEDTQKQLARLVAPKKCAGIDCPKDLQLVTYGMLCKLQQLGNGKDYVSTAMQILHTLLGIESAQAMKAPAKEVIGVVSMVAREMRRIGDLFNSIKKENTSEELQAGVDGLDFGTFGIADWYAKRMGITDHEDAYNTPWQRIYECMRIDHEQSEYEQRLRKIYENKNRRAKK